MGESKDVVKLQKDRLNIGEIVETAIAHNCGAVSTFIGTTRDYFEKKKARKLLTFIANFCFVFFLLYFPVTDKADIV